MLYRLANTQIIQSSSNNTVCISDHKKNLILAHVQSVSCSLDKNMYQQSSFKMAFLMCMLRFLCCIFICHSLLFCIETVVNKQFFIDL